MSHWIRRTLGAPSIFFTLTVVANNTVALTVGEGQPAPWATYAPLPPLAILLISGLYSFVLPYVARSSSR